MKTKLMKFATVAVLGMFVVVALPSFALAAPVPPVNQLEDALYSSIDQFVDGAALGIDPETGSRNWSDTSNINFAIAEDDTGAIVAGGGNGF